MTDSAAVFGCRVLGESGALPPRFLEARGVKPSHCQASAVIVEAEAAAELLARGASMAFVAGAPGPVGECVAQLAAQA